jgi:hypothetical protein
MSAKGMTEREWQEAQADAECERLMAMSDEEIIAHVRAQGLDPEIMAAETQAIFEKLIGRKKH